jgi:hypothetical protein
MNPEHVPAEMKSYFDGVNLSGIGALESPILWIAMTRAAASGRQCRDYTLTDEAGSTLLTARAFNWDREIVVAYPDGSACISILRSMAFAVSGRAAVRELPSGRALGRVTRNGTFSDELGAIRGRFQDARTRRDRARESLFHAAGEALLGAGEGSMPSGPDSFVLNVAGRRAGTLSYARLPSHGKDEAAPPSHLLALASRFLPGRSRDAWRSMNAQRGWRFERLAAIEGDPRLQVAAAIFAIELSRW